MSGVPTMKALSATRQSLSDGGTAAALLDRNASGLGLQPEVYSAAGLAGGFGGGLDALGGAAAEPRLISE